ncbi:hypothetical protein AGOR_G00194600 [Albula goreensis]|uniref:Uncharacterized protein n=1 Tax=Albula goreensis TaxID=1534307 RepID=A0A8T3CVQ7_9TELE|nr:hypothetical protein AGOR_G00194600 [Albula goreensis]
MLKPVVSRSPQVMLVWILLGTAFCADGLRYENRTQVAYGRDLVIPLSRKSAVLYFTPEASSTPILVWHARDPLPVDRGRGRGRGDGNHWILDGVTYEDQGKYTLYDNVNHILTTIILTVREERHSLDRRVNASMSIVLRVPLVDAQLSFTPEGSRVNHSLVRHGQIADESYRDRLRLLLSRIVLDDLTLEDSGTYDLRDSHFNLISTTRLYVSETGQSGSPYLGFLSLLGLIGGVFCCYKKKCCCFKRGKATDSNAHSVQHSPTQPEPKVFYHPSPNDPNQPGWTGPPQPEWTGPAGPPPNWNGPPQPEWTGPAGPPPNWNGPAGPPPNWNGPAGPPPNWTGPAGPAPNWTGPAQPNIGPNVPYMYPPPSPSAAHQPQWNPGAQPMSMGYAPVMYSAPPTATEPVKVEEQKEATATDSLMANAEETGGDQKPATTPSNPASSDFLHSTISGPEFKIDKGDAAKASDPAGSASETVNFL